jgi:hypothetical protein
MPARKTAAKAAKKAPAKRRNTGRGTPKPDEANRRRPGRPSKIDDVIGQRNGAPWTVFDQVVETMATGGYIETAAAMAGIHKGTIYEWLKIGTDAARRMNAGTVAPAKLTDHEWRCIEFADAVRAAEAEAEMRSLILLAQIAEGGLQAKTTTRKVEIVNGPNNTRVEREVERTEKVETLLPNAQVLEWRLERRHPQKYGRQVHEISGPDGGPIPIESESERVAKVLADLQAFKESQGEAS